MARNVAMSTQRRATSACRIRLVGVLAAAAAAGAWALPAAAATRSHASPAVLHVSCALVSPAEVRSTLGLTVGSPTSSAYSTLVQCAYPQGANARAVQISFHAETNSQWVAMEKAYGDKAIPGIGSGAFASSISTSPGSATDLYAYAHGEEFAIGAVVPLAKVEVLAKKIAVAL